MTEAIYRHFTRTELEAQFTLDYVDDLDGKRAKRVAASLAARRDLECNLGVAYGETPAETLDIFPADSSTPAPIQLFIHGGFWQTLDAATFSFPASTLVPAGAAYLAVDYALMPAVTMGEIVRQCRAAIAWTYRNAQDFNGDPTRIHISGHSAGGHLVAMLMDPGWPAEYGLPADVVKGGCAISGLFELEAVRLSSHNTAMSLTSADVAAYSPHRAVSPTAAPLILAVGGREPEEFRLQTTDYAEAWQAAGNRCEVIIPAHADHISILLDDLTAADAKLHGAVLGQMGLASDWHTAHGQRKDSQPQ